MVIYCIELYQNRTGLYKSRALIRLQLLGMGCRAVWYVRINVSKDPGTSVFYPEDGAAYFTETSVLSQQNTRRHRCENLSFRINEVLRYVIVSVTHCAFGLIRPLIVSNSEWRLENGAASSV